MKSQEGFATIMLLSLTPVLVAMGLALLFCFSFLKSDMAVLNVCRAGQLEVQNKVGKNLEKLLSLNPRALELRSQHKQAEAQLDAAEASGNPYAIAAAEANLVRVQMLREALDVRQRALIENSNMRFAFGTSKISRDLTQEWKHHNSAMTEWLQSDFQLLPERIPHLAVKPDIPDVAPKYDLLPQFEEAQSWVHSWQIVIHGVGWTGNFLTFSGRFERSCSTSLYSEDEYWIAKLKKAKSSSKAWF